jgi:hypothetical protein|nr:MAG TPA: hypothetical protein [Caudoviricetes sp.]
MKKITNKYLTFDLLKQKTSKKYGKQKWIIFAEELLHKGFKISLYEARRTFSKYLTVEKDGKYFKVRFSNHKPIKERELNNDCDFFVGVTNYKVTTTEDALKAVYNFFEEKEKIKMTEKDLQSVDLKELTRQMDEFKLMEAELKFNLKKTQEEIEKIELQLQNVIEKAGVESMDFGIYSFGWEIKKRKAFSQKAFAQVYPDLLEKFKLETETKNFVFKINK